MKRSRDYCKYKKVYFKSEFDSCPTCSSPLRRDHIAWRKGIQTMNGCIYATSYAFRCSNTACARLYRSTEADLLSVPFRTYSIDVVVEIGFLRHEEKRSMKEIFLSLRKKLIDISLRECYHLLHVFEEIIAIRPVEFDPDFYATVLRNGGVVIAIDGVQPERGNSTLYVVQDALSAKVLYADYLHDSSSDNIASIIRIVKDAMEKLGVPIIAAISDHQASIRLGVRKALPGIRHQFCHFHVLRNACLPITDMDRKLKKNIRKRIRGISSIERSLSQRNDQPSGIVRNACSMLRALLLYPGTKPLSFSGMMVFRELASLDCTVRRMLVQRHDKDLEKLSGITERWREFLPSYRNLRSLWLYAHKLRRILGSEASSDCVKGKIAGFLEEIGERITEGGIYLALNAMKDTIEHHYEGLFFCYDDPRIPMTDNGLEITIRHNKTGYRRISGYRSWDSFIANYGKSTFMIPENTDRNTLIEMADDVQRRTFMKRWKEYNERRREQSLMRSASRNYCGALKNMESLWSPGETDKTSSGDDCMLVIHS